ncbi:MAG: DNA gyrase subunit A [Clostridia bacterium]|nr:DNA gyrase subunit A [Clostridia bacterium]
MAKKQNDQNIEFPEQKILPINMEKEVRKSFIEYSMSVIVARALPDARDGMKPGQRRILYAMYEDNLTYDRGFRKSATTVGNVLGRYHPHGDTAVYLTMVRMAQPFSYRYMLVEGHGNFGSIDGDGPAAYRYTEARMSKLANEMMRDIEKDVVKWDMNFDSTRKEPAVLPARIPTLLVNGAIGIAVGMATNIPPHNLTEVIDGTIYFMDHPDAGVSELMQFIKGPDFPTGATIYGTAGIYEAYSTGRGRIMVRAKAHVEEEHHRIIITEIPYMVQKSELIKSMVPMVRGDKKVIDGVTDIRDESGRDGMRIVIEYRRDANGQIILNQLYKYTQLQDTCSAIMIALVNGEPKVLNLRQILGVYVKHQEEVITNRVKYDLTKALHEAHINEGYKIAIDHIDEVISIIRASADQPTARENLRVRFDLSEEQAQAIVAMTLGRLSGMERQKIEAKLVELYAAIEEFRAILSDPARIRQIIRDELTEIKAKFGDERRTNIEEVENEIMLEDLIERHNAVITLTHDGYIKRQPSDVYSAQRRGGRGVIGMATKEEDYIERVVVADSHSYLMLFTDTGRVHSMKAYRIPEAGRTSKGSNIVNIADIAEGDKITAMLSVPDLESEMDSEDCGYLVMVTERGVVKRTKLSEFRIQRKGGKIALTLDDGDRLKFVAHTRGQSDVMIATKNGYAARFDENQVRCMGRSAGGVRGISLRDGDLVAGACIVERDEAWAAENKLITITEGGFGKRMEASEFEAKGRGIMGVIAQKITDKTGLLCGIAVVKADEDIMMITNDGTIIRTPADGIPLYGRPAAGVIVMKLSDGAKLVNFALTEKEKEEEAPAAETEAAETTETDPFRQKNRRKLHRKLHRKQKRTNKMIYKRVCLPL